MPVAKKNTKHYGHKSVAGSNTVETCVRVSPYNPKRTMLVIQNTGDNPGLVHFEDSVQGDGSDLLFEAGSGLVWDRADTCPEAAINLGSADGTTWAIVEQVTK